MSDVPVDDDDLTLVVRVRAGDRTAMTALYERHHARLVAICTARLAGDRRLAEEIAHDALTRSWERLGQFEGGSFGAWVATIAKRLCVDHHRRARAAAADDPDGLAPDPVELVIARESARELWRAVGELPSRQAAAVSAALVGASTEAGVALGVDRNAMAQLLHRARANLRLRLVRLRVALGGLPVVRHLSTAPGGGRPTRWPGTRWSR